MLAVPLLSTLLLGFFPIMVNAYSFYMTEPPQQCQNVSFAITGFGTPPYSVTIVPTGSTPLPNGIEVREVIYQTFAGASTTVSFKLPWPQNSQFIAVVSDALGFGTGGTSVPINVQNSSDSSCFNATKEGSPSSFTFTIQGEIAQCNNIRFSMDGPTQGNLQFQGVIPGGESFQIQEAANIYAFPGVFGGTQAFNWTVTIRGGSEFIIVGGDSVGVGSGGHSGILGVAASGYRSNNTCINDQSPSSTAGTPAGGIPTSTSIQPQHSVSKKGAIAGGVVGGFAGIVVLSFILALAFRHGKRIHEERTDPSNHHGSTNASHGSRGDQTYRVEPFIGPGPVPQSSSPHGYVSESDPITLTRSSSTDLLHSGTRSSFPHVATGASGGGSPKRPSGAAHVRPVNIMEHTDAGPNERSETVELPPSYANIRRQLA